MSTRQARLSEYLDVEDEAETPKMGSLESQVRCRVDCMRKEGTLSSFLATLEAANPRLFAQLETCLANVQAVDDGIKDGLEQVSKEPELGVKRPKTTVGFFGQKWSALARFIPLRLSEDERRILAILDRTLKVSEYTDTVDIYLSKYNRGECMRAEIEKIKAILSGQFVAMKMTRSTELLTDEWFGTAFEIGRRYKAMNPDRLRETHVKLMYMLQDSRGEFPQFTKTPIRAVREAADPGLLADPLLDDFVHRSCSLARAELLNRYPGSDLVLDSISDYALLIHSFLDPVNSLLDFLSKFFSQTPENTSSISLAIRAGQDGARLSHSHSKQFQFVFQSMRLWREVLTYFMPLWLKAEEDLLGAEYRLADTGQGLNRVQSAPRAAGLMGSIVDKVQRELEGNWIGSSVVHMGDHNVPNALVFLDKYCQIPRILGPIAHTLRMLPREYESAPLVVRDFIDQTFGGVEAAQKCICADFFKHAFDGSGADNFYDAGSCIDGRLTSAWNWCSKIEKKSYFPLFLLTNFVGFDGQHGW